MRTIVVDASALVDYLFRSRAGAVQPPIEQPDADLHVPALCDIEVGSAIRRALLDQRFGPDHGQLLLAAYLDLPLTRHGHQALLPDIVRLRHNYTAYDAAYVALARALGAELLTADAALARAAARHVPVI